MKQEVWLRAYEHLVGEQTNPTMKKEAVRRQIEHDANGLGIRLFCGLENPELPGFIHGGHDFLYMDNSYFHRGSRGTKFRLIRRGIHLTRVLDRPADRFERLGVAVKPWRKTGRNVLLIPQSGWHGNIYGCSGWTQATATILRSFTDRPIVVKHDKSLPLQEFLEDAWCVVTYGSVAGVEAALAGVPVFSGPICPSLPISSGAIEKIETPLYPEREPWLHSLAYATWDVEEIPYINWKDYNYQYASSDDLQQAGA